MHRKETSMGPKDLGIKIKNYRVTRGMTQKEFADLMFIVPQTVSKWERGESYPDVFKLREVCRVLGVSIAEMLDEQSLYSSEEYMIAIDAGGAYTYFVLFKSDGSVIGQTTLETVNPRSENFDKSLKNLKNGIDQLSIYGKTPKRIYAAVSASRLMLKRLHAALNKMYPACVIDVVSDIRSLMGMLPPSPRCITANLGTGSIVCGFKGSSFDRIGGWGYLFDDAGSEYDIGKGVLIAAHEYADGLTDMSETVRLAEIKLGGSVAKYTDTIHIQGRNYIASFAPIAFEAYAAGDEVAKNIISNSAARLARLINHMYKTEQYGDYAFILCNFSGHSLTMCEFLKSELDPGINAEFCTAPSVLGAMKMCMRYEYGEMSFDDFDKNFGESYYRRWP